MKNLDSLMSSQGEGIFYFRYVDDILIIGPKDGITEVIELFINEVTSQEKLSLTLNEGKTYSNCESIKGVKIADEFEYLGYSLNAPKISPRKESEERMLRSFIALFCEYKKAILIAKKRKNSFTKIKLIKKIFMNRLNIKITGAISEKRRYGWIFYFIEMNDLSCLHRMDKIIKQQFLKLESFNHTPPPELKRMARAYYSALHSPMDGYIHNYNNFKTDEDKEKFLVENGYIEPEKKFSSRKIRFLFDKLKYENLSSLVQDETFVY
jgi:hypothetical protein